MSIKKPSLNIDKILLLRDKIRELGFYSFVGSVLDYANQRSLATSIGSLMPSVPVDVIETSLSFLVGSEITPEIATRTAWQFAGNLHRMRKGKIAWDWKAQREPEWMALQVKEVELTHKEFKSAKTGCTAKVWGADLKLRVAAGSLCPDIVPKFWSTSTCRYLSKTLGFVPQRRSLKIGQILRIAGHPMRTPADLLSLRLLGLFDSDTCKGGEAGFFQIACPVSYKKWNKNLIESRNNQGTSNVNNITEQQRSGDSVPTPTAS